MERPAEVQPAVTSGSARVPGPPAGPPREQGPREPAADVREHIEQTLALSYSSITVLGFYFMSYGAVTASYSLWLPQAIEASVGGRVGFGTDLHAGALEGYLSAGIAPHLGPIFDDKSRTAAWRPFGGVELGATTAEPDYKDFYEIITDLRGKQGPRPFYLSFIARPARFRFTNFNATLLGFGFGSPLADFGKTLRLQLEVVQVGYLW